MVQTLATPLSSSLTVINNGRASSQLLPNVVSFPSSSTSKMNGLTIRCVRVGGVEIPNNKRVEFSLQYIHGIGRTRAKQILIDLKMDNKITKDLSEEDLTTLRDEVSKYMIEGDLVTTILSNLI